MGKGEGGKGRRKGRAGEWGMEEKSVWGRISSCRGEGNEKEEVKRGREREKKGHGEGKGRG